MEKMRFTIQILLLLVISSCTAQKTYYHACCTSASSFKFVEFNISDRADRCAMKETVDENNRVIELEFFINSHYPILCYLPKVVKYKYYENRIEEYLYGTEHEPMIANECEMHYKSIYYLNNGFIVAKESHYMIDTLNYTRKEIRELEDLIQPVVNYKIHDSLNFEIEYYPFSYAKLNGKYPTNVGYKLYNSPYIVEDEPLLFAIKRGLGIDQILNFEPVRLSLLSNNGGREKVISHSAKPSEIENLMNELNWKVFHRVKLEKDANNFMEVGGSLSGEDFSIMYVENKKQYFIKSSPKSVDELFYYLLMYITNDESFKSQFE